MTLSANNPGGNGQTRFGTVVLLGKPNAGKSTLLNALVGEPLAIVSPKPQATWVPVVGIRTDDRCQMVFVDPPGVMDPSQLIHEAMMESVAEALKYADAALYLIPLGEHVVPLDELLPRGLRPACPVQVVRTKLDLGGGTAAPGELSVSALTGEGIDDVCAFCAANMPAGDFRYDADDVGTQPLRFFIQEFVREGAFENLGQELPYSVAVIVEEFREGAEPVYIRVTAFVERESQKGIFVGKGGRTVKAIGAHARKRMERLLGARVYLDLRVKVKAGWRKDPDSLRQFGYSAKTKKRKKK